jgi:hypothetical protein
MSISTQPLPSPPAPPSRGVSVTTLMLSLALAVSTTAAVILAVLYFRQPAAGADRAGGNPIAALFGDEPLVQKDTVSPQSSYTAIVYYPIPFGSPPNLKLTSTRRQYNIVKQDETGFTWMARPLLDDFKDDMRQEAEASLINKAFGQLFVNALKPNIQFEDFTWEAKGVRPGKDVDGSRPFEQTGKFVTLAGKEGEVNFPIPYALAPNVELSGSQAGVVIIVQSRPTDFKWKNGGDNNFIHSGEVTWKSKGVRATDIPRGKPE